MIDLPHSEEMSTEQYDTATEIPKKKTKKSKTRSEPKPVDQTAMGLDDLQPEPIGVCLESMRSLGCPTSSNSYPSLRGH